MPATTPSADDLTATDVLTWVADAEIAERRAGLAKLEAALRWCVLHPATSDTGVAVWGDAALPRLEEHDESLGGDGCPLVSAHAPEPFAAALAVSTASGMQLLADALDLSHRLPRTWRRVRRLEVAPWRARRLAQATHHLSREAAGYVDDRVADRMHRGGTALVETAVADAVARFDPKSHAEAETSGRQGWDVRLDHGLRTGDAGWAGTSRLDAVGDTLDLTKLYDLVCDHAAHLGRLGDTDPLGARKAKALGIIADNQGTLDLLGAQASASAPLGGDQAEPALPPAPPPAPPPVRRPSLTGARLYLHLSAADLDDAPAGGEPALGRAERLGPASVSRIREWLGATRATIVPVVHLPRELVPDDSVDAHDPPDWMREAVVLRDPRCVFPFCDRGSRGCDLDHIASYIPPDDGGPPGQTRAENLAPLCRRHHRAKTSRRWRYRREPDGSYIWQGPFAARYLVTPTSTHALAG